ncbi:MAG: ComEA family DNA-binding protein [Longimicrobiales bacterium]
MKLTADEARALGFIALLIGLSIGARLVSRPEPIELDAAGVDVGALEAASREAMKRKRSEVRPLRPGERIDPNTASLEELRRLPRMTDALAKRIVEARERGGGFRTLQDLDGVRGVGVATLEAWSGLVTLEAAPESPARAPTSRSPTVERSTTVDLNHATAAELERLPGVGGVLAQRIVALRDTLGGFQSLEQLERVRGIGPAMLEKLKPMVRLGS